MKLLILLTTVFFFDSHGGNGVRATSVIGIFDKSPEHLLCKPFNVIEYFSCRGKMKQYLTARNEEFLRKVYTLMDAANLKEFTDVVDAIIECNWVDYQLVEVLLKGITRDTMNYVNRIEGFDPPTQRQVRFALMRLALRYNNVDWWKTVLDEKSLQTWNVFLCIAYMVSDIHFVEYIDLYKEWVKTADRSKICESETAVEVFIYFYSCDTDNKKIPLSKMDRLDIFKIVCDPTNGWTPHGVNRLLVEYRDLANLERNQMKAIMKYLMKEIPTISDNQRRLINPKAPVRLHVISLKNVIETICRNNCADEKCIQIILRGLDGARTLMLTPELLNNILETARATGTPEVRTFGNVYFFANGLKGLWKCFKETLKDSEKLELVGVVSNYFQIVGYKEDKMKYVMFNTIILAGQNTWSVPAIKAGLLKHHGLSPDEIKIIRFFH